MFKQFILGLIQGIAEWLPVSSEGLLVLANTEIFHSPDGVNDIIRYALVLHLGTFFSALVYFRKDVKELLTTGLHFSQAKNTDKKLLTFLILTTIISGSLGLIILKGLEKLMHQWHGLGHQLSLAVGIGLIVTACLDLFSTPKGKRDLNDLNWKDTLSLGIAQGLACIPGLSRSGSTTSVLLLLGFQQSTALKLSFLMSLPLVLAGNILLNLHDMAFLKEAWLAVIIAFLFGLLTIDLLLKIAKNIRFGFFVLAFGFLTIIFSLIS